ncbi:MAG: hypothetical protein ACI30M_08140 [Muribaculaceae bacterium]
MNLLELVHNSVVSFISTIYSGRFNSNRLSFDYNKDTLLPYINKKSLAIQYGLKTDILLFLYNCPNQKIFYYYYLSLVCFQNNNLNSSEIFFNKLIKEINMTEEFIPKDITTTINKLTYQCLFCMLHEIGHAVFYYEENSKNLYINESLDYTKEFLEFWNSTFTINENVEFLKNIDSIKELSQTDFKYFIEDFSIVFQKGIIEEIINNNTHKKHFEELGADCFALFETSKIIDIMGIDHDSSVVIYSEYLNVLQCLSNITYFDQILFSGDKFNDKPLNFYRVISSLAIILPHFQEQDNLTNSAFNNLAGRNIINFLNESKSIHPDLSSLQKGNIEIDIEQRNRILCKFSELETQICDMLSIPE